MLLSERGEALKDIQHAPETLQVGKKDKQVQQPGAQISEPVALRHALTWLTLGCKITIQRDLYLGVHSVGRKLNFSYVGETQCATERRKVCKLMGR